jgi:hypothetical protein
MSLYYYKPYMSLPNYYGDAYVPPYYAAWQNYTVPYYLNPGYSYSPHEYAPRNDSLQLPTIPCKSSTDQTHFCPMVATFDKNEEQCQFTQVTPVRSVTATLTMAECQSPMTWPTELVTPAYVGI